MGIPGNELADQLAKQATEITYRNYTVSLAFLKQNIRKKKKDEWKSRLKSLPEAKIPKHYTLASGQLQPSNSIIGIKAPRKTISAYFQLKIGHGYFLSYLHRFRPDKFQNNECPTCIGKTQTPGHLLLVCSKYREQRKELKKALGYSTLSLSSLLAKKTSRGIQPVIKFLTETSIATRIWQIENSGTN
jgi:hypothetical protein